MAKVDKITGSSPLTTETLFRSDGSRAILTDATDGRTLTGAQLNARRAEHEASRQPVKPEINPFEPNSSPIVRSSR